MANLITEQEYTLTFSEKAKGWPSFYSFMPDFMIGMNKFFYTFKGGNLFRHNTNDLRNNFYGVQFTSKIKSVFNDAAGENKIFKTMNLEGDDTWAATMKTDIQESGFIQADWFAKKEKSWYAFVRNSGTNPVSSADYVLRSMNGIGRCQSTAFTINATEIRFSINPLVEIGSIVSVGDHLYYAMPPYTTPIYAGVIVAINQNIKTGKNYIRIDRALAVGNTAYFMYVKNSVAESHGVLGHYCVFEIENTNTGKVELFLVESEVMKSYP